MLIRLPKGGRSLVVRGSSGVGRNIRTDRSRRKTPALLAWLPCRGIYPGCGRRMRIATASWTPCGPQAVTAGSPPGELDARVERALSARTQGELAALVADLSAATATKDVLVVRQTGGKWTRAGRWTVPDRIEVRTKLCRVMFDFTDAVITSGTVRIDTDMQHGKLVIVGAPGIVIDAGGLNLVFSKTKLRSHSAAADPGLRIELVGTLKHAKVVERLP